ncbi:MAG: Glu/Leu/Phe/Val dehydrogenase dimerization domain-containing protein [Pseudomonadota bacterium]
MTVFAHPEFDDHEVVHEACDPVTGLKTIIAIHSTVLGPAAGGCRRWQYADSRDALTDVLRLSRGMTYKNAIAGLPFGGGKAVILAEPGVPATEDMYRAFGRIVDSLGGRYITAEDVGMSVGAMEYIADETSHVTGRAVQGDAAGGDPSPWTALGVFLGIEAAVKARLQRDSVKGLHIAVQGVGNVGFNLCKLLHEAGATLTVADVNAANLDRAVSAFGASVADPSEILFMDVDVVAPCALGHLFDETNIGDVKAPVIAGGANNQLGVEADGERLRDRGILYAPDYVINGGGIICVHHEHQGTSTSADVRADVERIPGRLTQIFERAVNENRATNDVANDMARAIVAAGREQATRQTKEALSA